LSTAIPPANDTTMSPKASDQQISRGFARFLARFFDRFLGDSLATIALARIP
jgi:hypothetical protein